MSYRVMVFALALVSSAYPAVAGAADGCCCAAKSTAPAAGARFLSTKGTYTVPAGRLTDQDGRAVELTTLLAADRPVVLNFIFTTCRTICPVMTSTLAALRQDLTHDAKPPLVVSISIDPEYDTPRVLKAFAAAYGADADWRFLNGATATVETILRAFDAYAGVKTNHRPLTFVRPPRGATWTRVEGLVSAGDLAAEYRRVVGGR